MTSDSFVKYSSKKIFASKFNYNLDNWIAFDIEWEDTSDEKNNDKFAPKTLDKNATGGSIHHFYNI